MKTYYLLFSGELKSEEIRPIYDRWALWARGLRYHHGRWFREGTKYVRRTSHQKKTKNQAREDWRRRKGFEKNFRKRCRGCCSSRKGWAKGVSNGKHRVMERELIKKERWEALHIKTPKNLFDRWLWD